jgi:hypothetical protein
MYLYAVLKSSTNLELPEGLVGPLCMVQQEQLGAVVEPQLAPETLRDADERVQLRAILCHDRVLQDLFQQVDVLPVPFGTFLVSEAALVQHLAAHQVTYLDKLQRIAQQAEYTLKAQPLPLVLDALPEETRGKDYFLAKKRRYQQQDDYRQQQQAQFQSLLEAIAAAYPICHSDPNPDSKDDVERIHLLVHRTAGEPLQAQVEQWQAQCSTWTLILGEALPPYHFV